MMQLYKYRKLGDIITDSFKFIREESERFFSFYLKIIWIYIAIAIFVEFAFLYSATNYDILSYTEVILIESYLGYFLGFFVNIFSAGTVLNYLRLYNENEGKVEYKLLRRGVYKRFWSYIGLSFIIYLIIFVSFFIIVIPAIYFAIVFSMGFPIMIIENKSVTDSIGECFKLIKDNWWVTFGTMIVVFLIIYVLTLSFSVPSIVYNYIKEGAGLYEYGEDPLYFALNLLISIASYFLNAILTFMLAFTYFDLHEIKYKTGINRLIEKIGS
ncbi:hypothetical protein [Aureivirga sp. CE67]|uniref:hypothetical protein n=1 Tax=Aureivirga sp. CE67 TaxID=1788983 RepID=UPI0018CA9685|nr:hypothetical protein [Aureivirga sp. CE67]